MGPLEVGLAVVLVRVSGQVVSLAGLLKDVEQEA